MTAPQPPDAPAAQGSLDRRIVRGSSWLALSYGGSQVVALVVTAVLARFVAPSAFGLIALASVALVALNLLQESGLTFAMIHRRPDVERSAGTAFVFTLVTAILLCIVGFAAAPLVSRLFGLPGLTNVLRVLLLMLPIRALGMTSGGLIERELQYGNRAKGELGGTAAQACTAIPLAVLGLGVWSLVAGQLVGQLVQSVVFWLIAPFRPSPRQASWSVFRELARYGRHLTAANLVAFVDGNIDTAVVGRLLGAAELGYYNLAWRLSNLPATGIGYIIGRAMFPAYSTIREDQAVFRETFMTNVRRVALVSMPVAVGILVAAEPIVVGIFGRRWEPAVTPLRILAVYGLIRSFSSTTGPVIQAAGRPQLIFVINVWHTVVIAVALVLLTPPFGLAGVATAQVAAAVASLVPACYWALRILDLRLSDLLADIGRPATCSLPVAAVVAGVVSTTGGIEVTLQLAVAVLAGIVAYVIGVLAFARGEVRAVATAFRA